MASYLNKLFKMRSMKKLLIAGAAMIFLLSSQLNVNAQIRLGLSINLGTQPEWGPAGYGRADYYYLPDVDAYYDVPSKQFIYLEGNNWVFRSSLPAQYRNYDLYNGYKVVINEPRPYMHATYYRDNYGQYRNWQGTRQVAIRDRRNDRRNDRHDDRRFDSRGRDNRRRGHH